MSQPAAGGHLARFLSVTIYVPGEKPHRYKEGQILAAGMQQGTSVCAVRNDEGEIVEYLGLPMKVTKGEPTGLVAPLSGGVIIPPT